VTVENMRLAVMIAPVRVPAGVAARSLRTTMASRRLSPMVQTATVGASVAHQWVWRTRPAAAKGRMRSRTNFDCQLSLG